MKCDACAKDADNPQKIDWVDCTKHFGVEDKSHHRMLLAGTVVAVTVIIIGILVICIAIPAVMLYG